MEITENKIKEILTEQRTEFQHIVGIFKEDLESKINLIAEQYQDIKSTQKFHTEMIGSLQRVVKWRPDKRHPFQAFYASNPL